MNGVKTVLPETALFRALYGALILTVIATFDGRIIYLSDASLHIPSVWLQLLIEFLSSFLLLWLAFVLIRFLTKHSPGGNGEGKEDELYRPEPSNMPPWLGGGLLSLLLLLYTGIRGVLQTPFLGHSFLSLGEQSRPAWLKLLIYFTLYLLCYWIARLGDLWVTTLQRKED